MEKLRIKLLSKKEVASGTMSFEFERPKSFTYSAGQTIDLLLINPIEIDERGNGHTFSLASAPYENTLLIATRMRGSAYKNSLQHLKPGDIVEIDGPFGSFTLHKDPEKPAVFLAGGIGITPFFSIIKQALYEERENPITLFYSNRILSEITFKNNLDELASTHENMRIVHTLTDEVDEHWHGETGYIDETMLTKNLPDVFSPIYYIAGPPRFVDGMRKVLSDIGVDADNVRFEDFRGY